MLPMVALVAFFCIAALLHARESILASLHVKSLGLAEGLDREIAALERLLRSPPVFDALERGDRGGLASHFGSLAASQDWVGAIAAFDAAGLPVAATPAPFPRGFPLRFMPNDSLMKGDPWLSGLIEDGDGGEIILLAVPAIHRGLLTGTLVVELDAGRFQTFLDARRPRGTAVTLFDASGQVLARTPDNSEVRSREPAPRAVAAFLSGQTVAARIMNEPAPDFIALRRVDSAPWAVAVSIQDAEIRAQMRPLIVTALGVAGAAFVLAIGLALLLGNRLGRRISALASAADAIRKGSVQPEISDGVREIERVAAALAAAAAQVDARISDREADHASAMARAQTAARFVDFTMDIASRRSSYHGPLDVVFGVHSGGGRRIGTWDDLSRIVHPDDFCVLADTFDRLARDGGAFDVSYRIVRPDTGEVRWLVCRGETAAGPDGRPASLCGVILDMSGQKQAEARVKTSEERLRLAQQAARVGSWDLGLDKTNLGWSPEQFALHDVAPQAQPTLALWLDAVHPDDREILRRALVCGAQEFEIEYRVHSTDGLRWLSTRGRCIPDETRRGLCRFFGVTFDITDRKAAEERRILMTRELHHRVNNTLQTVQAIVSSSMRTATDMQSFRDGLSQRIGSLAKTHALLTGGSWATISLADILRVELDAYDHVGRIRLDGPSLRLPSQVAISLGMVVHELTTNAAKHGALSAPTGHVSVEWRIDRANGGKAVLHLSWTERGGPPVQSPTRRGFGSSLIERVVNRQLHGAVDRAFESCGVRVRLTMPLPVADDSAGGQPPAEAKVAALG